MGRGTGTAFCWAQNKQGNDLIFLGKDVLTIPFLRKGEGPFGKENPGAIKKKNLTLMTYGLDGFHDLCSSS